MYRLNLVLDPPLDRQHDAAIPGINRSHSGCLSDHDLLKWSQLQQFIPNLLSSCMVITMSNNCCLFSGISRRFHGNGTHPRQTLIDTSCLIQLDDHAFICTHNRLDVQRSGKKRLKSGKTAILPKSIQSLQNKNADQLWTIAEVKERAKRTAKKTAEPAVEAAPAAEAVAPAEEKKAPVKKPAARKPRTTKKAAVEPAVTAQPAAEKAEEPKTEPAAKAEAAEKPAKAPRKTTARKKAAPKAEAAAPVEKPKRTRKAPAKKAD